MAEGRKSQIADLGSARTAAEAKKTGRLRSVFGSSRRHLRHWVRLTNQITRHINLRSHWPIKERDTRCLGRRLPTSAKCRADGKSNRGDFYTRFRENSRTDFIFQGFDTEFPDIPGLESIFRNSRIFKDLKDRYAPCSNQ